MRNKKVIVIAIVLGLAAIFLVNYYLSEQRVKYVEQYGRLVPVLTAVKEIPRLSMISADMVTLRGVPLKFVQPKALSSKDGVVGMTTIAAIMPGEQVLATKLITPDVKTSMSMKTPPGKRAVTIGVDNIAAAGGFITPGDHVDVLGLFKITQQVAEKEVMQDITVTLFQNVLVLAVGGRMVGERDLGGEGGREDRVTLALNPQETELILFAQDQGKIRLVLRSEREVEVEVDLPPTSWETLLERIAIKRAGVEQKVEPSPSIEVYRGLEKETTPIPGLLELPESKKEEPEKDIESEGSQ